MAQPITNALPASIVDLVQNGALERAFHDALFPTIQYRAEAVAEEWPAQLGQEIIQSRPGLLAPVVKPLVAGADPEPSAIVYEQWVATLAQYGSAIDTHMPTAATANANLFVRNIQQLGLQAGQSINRIARNTLFRAYLAGNTMSTAAIASTDTLIRVASLNGFTSVLIPAISAQPRPVSAAFPLPITIGSGVSAKRVSVIGYNPDDPNDLNGPGQLVLSAQVGAVFAGPRTPIVSLYASKVVRPTGGASVDTITSGDTISLQQVINAVALLRRANVQPHEDGFYHAHISPIANAQFFQDPVFQRLNQSLPEYAIYREGFIGHMGGVAFFLNTDSPETPNVGTLIPTGSGSQSFYAPDLGGEIINGSGVPIGHTIITGKGALMEKWLDEGNFMSEAGLTGKVGDFQVLNNGIAIQTDRIRLILRAPLDRLQQQVSAAWSISTSFPVPSDILAQSGPEQFKRAIVLQHVGV
jgi:hypothetical protein